MKTYALIAILAAGLAACDQKSSPDGTKERARAEQEAGREVENNNQAAKAERMELELKKRHLFYAAVQGQYEGNVQVGKDSYRIKLTLSRSIAPYTGDRVRQLSEIEADLNNLSFNAQVVQWHAADPETAVGCRVGQIRPELDRGVLVMTSSDCPNLYKVYISQGGARAFEGKEGKAETLAAAIKAETVGRIDDVVGTIQPSLNANTYTFAAKRVQ